MNIVKENLQNQTALLKVTVDQADYNEAVEKALRQYKKKANVPGFRPGMVPMGVINKMYRKGTLAEETYRIASQECFKYVENEKIEFVGDIMPSDQQGDLDFDNDKSFEFAFELGIAPQIQIELTKKDKVTKHEIKIEKKLRDSYRENFLKRFGQLVDVDKVENDEAVNITLDQPEMNIEDAYISLIGMSEDERKPFIGKKVGDTMEVDVNELYKNPTQRAAILSVKEDELDSVNPKFTLTITKIRKFAEPAIDETLFKMAFPDGNVTSEEEFEKYIDTRISEELNKETEQMLNLDIQNFLVEKANLSMPEEFLKKWLFSINEGRFSFDEIEKDFTPFLDMMRWNLIMKHYVKTLELKIEKEEALAEAINVARAQFAQYGMGQVADDMLTGYANTLLENKEEARKIYDRVMERKVFEKIEPQVTISTTKVTPDEFGKLVEKIQQK